MNTYIHIQVNIQVFIYEIGALSWVSLEKFTVVISDLEKKFT